MPVAVVLEPAVAWRCDAILLLFGLLVSRSCAAGAANLGCVLVEVAVCCCAFASRRDESWPPMVGVDPDTSAAALYGLCLEFSIPFRRLSPSYVGEGLIVRVETSGT